MSRRSTAIYGNSKRCHISAIKFLKMRRAKILATLGPASSTQAMIESMITAGVNAVRINMSHGTQEEHSTAIERARAAAASLAKPLAILVDLSGPKIRTRALKNEIGRASW